MEKTQRIAADWENFELLLKTVGYRKLDLARVFGIHDASISRWKHNGVPQYAFAYLSQVILAMGREVLMREQREKIEELETRLERLAADISSVLEVEV